MLKQMVVRRSIGLCVLLLGLSGELSRAQAPDATTGRIQVTSRLVVLDVRVVDRSGHFIPGLDRSQFQVFEGKLPQSIRTFEGPESHAVPANAPTVNSTADLEKRGNIPVNILVIDELNTAFMDTARSRDAIKHFLESQPAKLPVPTLFLGVGNGRVAVLHDFTQNRDELLANLKSHRTDVDLTALTNQINGGTMRAQNGFAKTLGALSQVASSVRGLPGHKNVIWVGTGFDQAYDLTQATDSDTQKITDALKLVTERMMDARISLSTLDPVGVDVADQVENLDAEAQVGQGTELLNLNQDASFDTLAETTGGTVVHGRNDLDRLIAQDAAAANEYYTLSYVPSSASNDPQEFRDIRVVMRNPDLRAITRTGYYPTGVVEPPVTPEKGKTQTSEFKFDLTSSANSHMVYTGLHVFAQSLGNGYNVQVQANDLTWKAQEDGNRISEFSVVGVAFNARDKVIAQLATEVKERVKETDNLNGARVGTRIAFSPPASATRVRFVVRDASTGNLGSFEMSAHP